MVWAEEPGPGGLPAEGGHGWVLEATAGRWHQQPPRAQRLGGDTFSISVLLLPARRKQGLAVQIKLLEESEDS